MIYVIASGDPDDWCIETLLEGPDGMDIRSLMDEYDTLYKAATKGLRVDAQKRAALESLNIKPELGFNEWCQPSPWWSFFIGFLKSKGLQSVQYEQVRL